MQIAALVGQTVGNWRLGRLLGEGAFGAVFAAEHVTISGRLGAVKVLRPELSMQATMKQRFLNEASAASRADHENIVQIFDGGITPEGLCYSVMEMLKGQVLSDALKRGPLGLPRTLHVGAQIASALQAAHALDIVHRDLKPDNIFLSSRQSDPDFVKVLDFGVAKLRGDLSDEGKLTGTGMLIGTSAYMSPEQWRAEKDLDGRSDIYSLGVILFECLAGTRPFRGTTLVEWAMLHLESQPPDLLQYGVPAPMSRLVGRMLEKRREVRPQSMREVVQELHAIQRGLATEQPATQVTPQAQAMTQVPGQLYSQPQPAYPQQQLYSQPQPAYPQQQLYSQPQAAFPQPQLYQQAPPSPGLLQNRRTLLKVGEILLGVLIATVYAIYNWGEVTAWFKQLLTLKLH